MNKKIVVCALLCAALAIGEVPMCLAQTSATGPSGSASATVPNYLEFSMRIVKRMDSA